MRRVVAAAVVLAGLIAVSVSGQYDEGYTRVGYAIGGGASAADTFKLLVRNSANPPTIGAVADSGLGWIYADAWYDSVLEASDGTSVRYGSINSSTPTVEDNNVNGGYAPRAAEFNRAAPARMTFLAFNLDLVPANSRIESAALFINVYRLATNDLSVGYFAARADTVVSDYAMLNSTSVATNLDLSKLNISYNEVDVTNSVSWDPALTDRDDWNDFGPRSNDVYAPGGSVPAEWMVRLDVTEAVQQIIDNGTTSGWVIFVIYGVNTASSLTSWGYGYDPAKVLSGSPALSLVTTSKRGVRPWGGTVPITQVWDDNLVGGYEFWAIQDSAGHSYSSASYDNSWASTADSIWSASGGDIDILVHTKTHQGLGTLTEAQLDYELARDWLPLRATGIDTTALTNFAWVGGGTMEDKYSLTAIKHLVANGYNTCRAVTYIEDTPIGDLTYPAWDQYVNLFAVQSLLHVNLFAETTEAGFRDFLDDLVDDNWTNHYRSAVMIYGHGWNNGATNQKVRWLMQWVEDKPYVTFRRSGWIMGQLADRPRVSPSAITAANGATARIEASAAMYDSALTATPAETWPERVWVGPK